jgi:PEP-CTERM/exosortase A-associated glycosyltransferase
MAVSEVSAAILERPAADRGDNGKVRVLHVLDHSLPVLSGYAVRSRGLVTGQARLGQPIAVVTSPLHQMDDADAHELTVDNVTYFRTPIPHGYSKIALGRRWPLLREWEVVRLLRARILQLIDSQPVDIVYAHSPALCGLAGLQAARKRGLPFVYEIRAFWEDAAVDQDRTNIKSLRYGLTRHLETYLARNADAVCGIAKSILDELRSRGIPQEKLFHTPNGVDAERFRPLERDLQLATTLNLPDAPVLGFFGSFYRYEGVTWLIRAAAELRKRGNQFVLLLIGRGEEGEKIRAAIQECGMEDNVRLLDHVPYDQIQRYYSLVDVMVFPRLSVRITEQVTPLKPLEAMSLSQAVLGSAVGGIRELVKHEETGLLFQPENIQDFCYQAERLLHSPELRAQLGRNGRETILREKDWNVLARRYQTVYDYVLDRRSAMAK